MASYFMPRVPDLHGAGLDQPDTKREFNRTHFAEAAPRYDLVTKVLSFGGDAVWKRRLVDALSEEPATALDLACGTGDVCFLLAERFSNAGIEGLDLTREMLDIAERRNQFGDRVGFVEGDICNLPQADASKELITGSYALRNAPDLLQALQEIHRVLKPGGVAAFLDFSKSPSRTAQRIQYVLLRFWGGLWGLLLHGNPAVHGYIAASLRAYPDRQQLDGFFKSAGFERVSSRLFYGGMTEMILLRKESKAEPQP